MLWVSTAFLIACGSDPSSSRVEAYLANHPHTLEVHAAALRRGEIVPEMTHDEVAVLLGEPMNVVIKGSPGRRRLNASYRGIAFWNRDGTVRELKGPVSLTYEEHASGQWRLTAARSIWR